MNESAEYNLDPYLHNLFIRTLPESVDAGNVLSVSYILRALCERSTLSDGEQKTVNNAKEWLRFAKEHERQYGARSMINRNHPFNKDRRAILDVSYRAA